MVYFASDGGAAMTGKAMELAVKLKHKTKEFSYSSYSS
jgi:hypothetical protein